MKKLLIISSTFFPDKTVGAIRISQWARHLPEFGWKPTILCRYYGESADQATIARELNEHVEINYLDKPRNPTNVKRSNGVLKKLKRSAIERGAEFVSVPDVSVWSWRKLQNQIDSYVQSLAPHAVLTSSPRHSIHTAGLSITNQFGTPWVADFRDPFLCDIRYRAPAYNLPLRAKFNKYETRVINQSAACTLAIKNHYNWLLEKYPDKSAKLNWIPNGFPIEMLDQDKALKQHGTWKIVTAGMISNEGVTFASGLIKELISHGIDAQFFHFGDRPHSTIELSEEVAKRVHFFGRVPHQEAVQQVADADFLLAINSDKRSTYQGLSSKLFEYLATGTPIMVIRPTKPDAEFLRSLPWVICQASPDFMAAAAFIKNCIENEISASPAWLTRYHKDFNRRTQTQQIASILEEISA